MVGEVALINTSINLKKGLEKFGHEVVIQDVLRWRDIFRKKYGEQRFDIVHIQSPNFKKLCIGWRYIFGRLFFSDAKLVCHWHGSDLRHSLHAFPVYRLLKLMGDFHLYSTLDLRWWLRNISDDKKLLFNCPVDIDHFKPSDMVKEGGVVFNGGGKSFAVHRIPHEEMHMYLNRFETVDVHNDDGLDDGLLSVIALEAACCGCKVPQLSNLNRQWVVENASIDSQTKKIIEVYERLLND